MIGSMLASAAWLHSAVLAERVAWTLVHFLWQGAAAAAGLALLSLLMRQASPVVRYRASCIAMLTMALAPALTFWTLGTKVSAHAPIAYATTAVPLHAGTLAERSPTMLGEVTTVAPTPPRDRRLEWLAAGWGVGVLALSLWRLAGWAKLRRLMRDVDDVPGSWRESLSRIASRLEVTRPVRIMRASWVAVPSVVGVFRPVVLFPAGAIVGLTPGQFEALLAHELAHVRRGDYVVNLLQVFVETLLFYHPAVWWVSARVREEREHCCDDLAAVACGDRVQYADALASMEELRALPSQIALAAGGDRGALLRRVRRVLDGGPSAPGRRSLAAVAAACVALPLAAAGLLAAAGEEGKQPPAKDAPAVTTSGERGGSGTAPTAIDWSAVVATEVEASDLELGEVPVYTIAANDLLRLMFADLEPGKQSIIFKRVPADGTIKLTQLPEGSAVRAAGRTERELEKAIDDAYRAADPKRAKPVQSSVTVTEARGRVVSVMGGVKKPGQYAIGKGDYRLLDALDLAGGKDLSDVDEVNVFRATPKPRQIRVSVDRLRNGDARVNLIIRPGDIVVVRGGPKLARLEIGAGGKLRFQDAATTWDALPALLEKIPASVRGRTQFVMQVVSKDVSVKEYSEAVRQASALAEANGFRHITTVPPVNLFPKDVEPPADELIGEYYMGGQVDHPGAYSIVKRIVTLRQAVVSAGVPKDLPAGAKLRVVRRTSDGEQIIERDAQPLLKDGTGDLPMRPEDQAMLLLPKPAEGGK
jgi:protein involved in polysaccharide export with SLBB domain/beta-lactamase regulating signal transducer with metallopeptidase domain